MKIENAKMEIEAEFTEMTFEKRHEGAGGGGFPAGKRVSAEAPKWDYTWHI